MRIRNLQVYSITAIIAWSAIAAVAMGLLLARRTDLAVIAIAATSLPLGGMVLRHLTLSRHLRQRHAALRQNLTEFELAEGMAQIGRWSIEIAGNRHRLSDEMRRIVGLGSRAAVDDALLSRLMPGECSQLEATLLRHREDQGAFIVEFEIERDDGETRLLRASAKNDFGPDGALERVFMVVRDVTDEYRNIQIIERERGRALREAEEARRLANTDALTGLANRRAIMAELDRAIMGSRRDGRALALVMFDIDHFKQVNDTHGHQAGDLVLQTVARLAGSQARKGDLIGRIGGEEFLWLMPTTGPKEVSDAAERLRWAIESGTASAPVPAVTVSVGTAVLDAADVSLSLFARADEALYAAKNAGRNQVRKAA